MKKNKDDERGCPDHPVLDFACYECKHGTRRHGDPDLAEQVRELVELWLRDYPPPGCPDKGCISCNERRRRQSELRVAVGLPPVYACDKCRRETAPPQADKRCPACAVGRVKPVDPVEGGRS